MTSEELAALKVGDEVLVRATIRNLKDEDGDLCVHPCGGYDDDWIYIKSSSIHSLAPPKPLAVGDWATFGSAPWKIQILAFRKQWAWCVTEDGQPSTYETQELTRTTEPTK